MYNHTPSVYMHLKPAPWPSLWDFALEPRRFESRRPLAPSLPKRPRPKWLGAELEARIAATGRRLQRKLEEAICTVHHISHAICIIEYVHI